MESTDKIKRRAILVVGDVMLDQYYEGSVKRISPEAPVPVFQKQGERYVLGGAANVAANLIAAGQSVSMMSIIGNDDAGSRIVRMFEENGVDTSLIYRTKRNTTVKTRFVASNNQQVMRLDVEDTFAISKDESDEMVNALSEKIKEFDLVIISDYLKGLLTEEFTQQVIGLANKNGIKVVIDVKDPKYEKYKHCYLLKPNLLELHSLTGLKVETDNEIITAARVLLDKCRCEYVLVTAGARGMILVDKKNFFSVKSVGKEVFDVTGAGDTTIAYLAVCIANQYDMNTAVEISNYAAGIQVAKVGTSAVYLDEVREFLQLGKRGRVQKLIGREALACFRKSHQNKKIVFTNGCFDILHAGHVRYLQEAAGLGDILVVGLNSDASVKRLKGEERPINSEGDRAEVLCALEYVDYVVIFEEDTPLELITALQPDVLVKGGDYTPEEVVGKDVVEARGGKLVLVPFVEGKSTTNIINRMRQ